MFSFMLEYFKKCESEVKSVFLHCEFDYNPEVSVHFQLLLSSSGQCDCFFFLISNYLESVCQASEQKTNKVQFV